MKALELLIERIIISSRWLLVIFYLGLAVALGIYTVSFGHKLLKVSIGVLAADESIA